MKKTVVSEQAYDTKPIAPGPFNHECFVTMSTMQLLYSMRIASQLLNDTDEIECYRALCTSITTSVKQQMVT